VNQHALDSLEFQRIADLLVDRAASLPGKRRLRAIRPCESIDEARAALALLHQQLTLRLQEPSWPEIPVPDLDPLVARAQVAGSVLDPESLQDVARTLQLGKRVRGVFGPDSRREAYPGLAELASRLILDTHFADRIERTFEASGELRDDASPELRSIRMRLRRRQQQVSQRLSGMSRSFRESGEDSFVTLRSGRYVLSVAAADQRRLAGGIVHDRSATGKTVYVEPLEIVELNNSLAEMEADERREVHHILRQLSAWVRDHAGELLENQEVLAAFDELNARSRLCEQLEASMPQFDSSARTLRLVKARHPLLQLATGRDVVALQLDLTEACHALVVSGPNMGGKTVVLKTAGLLVLMAMAGLFVPAADGTTIPWVDGIFVDIGDEQSLDCDLSTYAGHLRNMKAILNEATGRSLVLIDELGAGTDPDEGAALGIALLQEVGRRRALCVTTTHLGAFKTFASEAAGFANAAMEHDPETLAPTYTMYVGLPGRSHAFELARREGWPPGVLAAAGALMDPDRLQTETLLAQIQKERTALEQQREEAARDRERLVAARRRCERLTGELQAKTDALKLEKALAEDQAFGELRRMLRDAKEKLARLEAREKRPAGQEARRPRSLRGETDDDDGESLGDLRRWVHAQEREAAEMRKGRERPPLRAMRAMGPSGPSGPSGPTGAMGRPQDEGGVAGRGLLLEEIVPGARAFARSLGVDVVIESSSSEAGRVWVNHNSLRVQVQVADLEIPHTDAPQRASAGEISGVRLPEESNEMMSQALRGELDLRGLDQEAAQERLERFLDRVVMAGVTRVRIIHGKGTGALRRRVVDVLERQAAVQSHREGEPGEGGWGVTIAFLEKSAGQGGRNAFPPFMSRP